MDRRPDRGYGLDRSSEFPVLIGLGPVRSRSFSSLETGPSNTNFYAMFCLNKCVISLYCSILTIKTCSAVYGIVDTVLYALRSVSTIHKACFSRLMQQLNQISAGARCLYVLIAMPCFKFVLISRNEVKHLNLFVLALGPYPVDQQKS